MLIQPTIEKLCAMRLRGMAEAFEQQQQDANIHGLSFEERLGLLIDRQWNWRQNRALDRRLRNGRLQGPACVEDLQSAPQSGPRPSCAERGPASRFCHSRSPPYSFPFLFQPGKMGVETVVGLPDQLAVESFLAHARLVAVHEQDRLALCVEGEGHSPFAIRRAEAQFLHVRVAGAVQGVNAGPPQLRAEPLKKDKARISVCTSSCSASNSRSNSSPIDR